MGEALGGMHEVMGLAVRETGTGGVGMVVNTGHLVEETGIFISGLFLLPVTPKLLSAFPLDLPSHWFYSSSAFIPSFCIIFLVFSLCLSLGSPQSVPRDKDVSASGSF